MPYKSQAQRRFMYAAEARGEVPKGTADRWSKETKNIKSLPERKMEKDAMFFGEREEVEDGNFMKLAQSQFPEPPGGKPGEEIKVPGKTVESLPVKQKKPKAPEMTPPKSPLPVTPEKPEVAFGTGCKKTAMPFGTGIGVGGSPQFGGSGTAQSQMGQTVAGAGGTPGMGTGEKLKKKLKKQAAGEWEEAAEAVKGIPAKWSEALGRAAKGTAELTGKGAKALAEAEPTTQAAALGIPAYIGYSKAKKAIKGLGKKAPPSGVATALRKLFTRGR